MEIPTGAAALEVVRLDPRQFHPWGPISGGTPVALWTGPEADESLALLEALPPGDRARCFVPTWGLRAHDAELNHLYDVIPCFSCNLALLTGPAVPEHLDRGHAFDRESPAAKELLARFRAAEEIPAVVPAGRMRALPQPEFDLPAGMRLRRWAAHDAPALVDCFLDPDIRHWNRPSRLDLPGAEERITRFHDRWQAEEAAIWAIAPAAGGPAVGLIGLADLDLPGGSGEILYWLLPAGRGSGVMVPATTHVTRWAFDDLGLHRVRITHSVANPASCAVATKAGFPLEGTMRGALLHADGWHDEHLHARLRTDSPL
ncbi:GNAT family N-acetyltransferase [Streptomyces sp. NPDC001513]|uniref:GNAT family N-acetyltransferase n=1 Tax=Streptomyces sp. NPDC001513 TaxID=3364580 RepID=UPI0036C1F25B